MAGRYGSRGSGDGFIMALALLVVIAVVACYLLYKACELVARMLIAHPRNRPLWAAVVVCLLSLTAAALASGGSTFLNLFAVLSFLGLLAVCKVVELYHDNLLQVEVTKENALPSALRRAWWDDAPASVNSKVHGKVHTYV